MPTAPNHHNSTPTVDRSKRCPAADYTTYSSDSTCCRISVTCLRVWMKFDITRSNSIYWRCACTTIMSIYDLSTLRGPSERTIINSWSSAPEWLQVHTAVLSETCSETSLRRQLRYRQWEIMWGQLAACKAYCSSSSTSCGWLQVGTQITVFVVVWGSAYKDVTYFAGEEVDALHFYLFYAWSLIILLWIVHGVNTSAQTFKLLSSIDYMSVRETQVSYSAIAQLPLVRREHQYNA